MGQCGQPYFLYELKFPNGKRYLGISNAPAKRFRSHKAAARKGSTLPVHCAIRKYGADNIGQVVLACGTRDYVADLEIRAIAHFRPAHNISPGGDISPMLTEATRAKVAASMRERFKDPEIRRRNVEAQRLAQNRPEVLAARSKQSRGRKPSEEARVKMSAARKGRKHSAEHVLNRAATQIGAKRSDESRQRMSEGQKKRERTPEEIARLVTLAKGRTVTPEHREKLRVAALARWAKVRGAIPT